MGREKILIVVDVQNDFVNGVLGTEEAKAIIEPLQQKLDTFEGAMFFTQDTHDVYYLNTQEGRNLPVPHCIKGTVGWELVPAIKEIQAKRQAAVFEKGQFASLDLARAIQEFYSQEEIEYIELVGICTDICVLANAMLLKAYLPEVPIRVDATCCAGVNPTAHAAALTAMASCQIEILR